MASVASIALVGVLANGLLNLLLWLVGEDANESNRVLIEKGKLVAEKYRWEKTAEKVWNELMKAARN